MLRKEPMDSTLSARNDTSTLSWLMNALERARSQDQTRLVGYLEAILDDVVFEMESTSRAGSIPR
jgi:hypothetical protein